MIFVSQCFLLDQTPAVFGLKVQGRKVNAAFFYLMYLCFYSFLLDVYSGFVNLAYSIFFYSLVPKFGNWVTRVVGVKWTNSVAFLIYLISQYSQILLGHELRENFYDWNIYQVSIDFPCQLFFSQTFPVSHRSIILFSSLLFNSCSLFGTSWGLLEFILHLLRRVMSGFLSWESAWAKSISKIVSSPKWQWYGTPVDLHFEFTGSVNCRAFISLLGIADKVKSTRS